LNSEASLQDHVEYFSASTITVMTGIAEVKLAGTLSKASTAGYIVHIKQQ